MVGGGIYSLPQEYGRPGFGRGCDHRLGRDGYRNVFPGEFLSHPFRHPTGSQSQDLHVAERGFGSFVGFLIAWGYWLCQIFGNVDAVIWILNYFFHNLFSPATAAPVVGGSVELAIQFCGTARDTAGCRDQHHRYDRQTHSVVRVYHYYDFRFSYR